MPWARELNPCGTPARLENHRVPGARVFLIPVHVALWTLAGCIALVGGGLAGIASTVGVCAAVGVLLYGAAHLLGFIFGFGFMWGLVIACWILLVGLVVGR
jgi:hypothetical protein